MIGLGRGPGRIGSLGIRGDRGIGELAPPSPYTWTTIDDFEDGTVSDPTNSDWVNNVDGSDSRTSIVSDALQGSQSYEVANPFENFGTSWTGPNDQYDALRCKLRPGGDVTNDDFSHVTFEMYEEGNGVVGSVAFAGTGEIIANGYTDYIDGSFQWVGTTIGTFSPGTAYDVEITEIDYSAETYSVAVNGVDADASTAGVAFRQSASSTDEVWMRVGRQSGTVIGTIDAIEYGFEK